MFCSDTGTKEHTFGHVIRHSNVSIYGGVEVERMWSIKRKASNTVKLKPEITILITKNWEEACLF